MDAAIAVGGLLPTSSPAGATYVILFIIIDSILVQKERVVALQVVEHGRWVGSIAFPLLHRDGARLHITNGPAIGEGVEACSSCCTQKRSSKRPTLSQYNI